MSLIKAKDIEKTYTTGEVTTRVLSGVSVDVDEGEFVAIMGPSGSGKSTLMHILGLLDKPTKGSYLFNDQNVDNLDDSQLALLRSREIGFVFQAFNLLPRTTVLENVKLPLVYSKKPGNHDEMAKKVLDTVGLSHRLEHHNNQLSGGERQRVAIARALINNPSIIFADEPTGNLDSKTGDQIINLLSRLNKEGNTIIMVTHELDIAKKCNRLITLKDGMIEKDELMR